MLAGEPWLPYLAQAGTTLTRINKSGYSFLNYFSDGEGEKKKSIRIALNVCLEHRAVS